MTCFIEGLVRKEGDRVSLRDVNFKQIYHSVKPQNYSMTVQ